jgi:hypothetical protein
MARCGKAHPSASRQAFQPHAADVLEHRRAVTRQMLNELDRSPLGPADQLSEPPLSFERAPKPSYRSVTPYVQLSR